MKGFEENEISIKSNGGTELMKRRLANALDPELLDNFQIVCSRVRELDPNKIRIMYYHDLPLDPEVAAFKEKSYRNKFHAHVFVSHWQYEMFRTYLGYDYKNNAIVIEHGFEPIPADWEAKAKSETIKFCYTSTPQRGLGILVPVFAKFAETHPDVHLDVFSSFKIYGWEDRDKQFEPLYEQITNHPQMTYHGSVPNQELRDYLSTAHVLAYPCVWQETSCLAMEEAMSAGLLCVHSSIGALPDTSGHLNQMYDGDADANIHAMIFLNELENSYQFIKAQGSQEYFKYVKMYADGRYNMLRAKDKWNTLLQSLLHEYPNGKRGFPSFEVIDTNNLHW